MNHQRCSEMDDTGTKTGAFAEPRHIGCFPLLEMRCAEGRGRFLVAARPIPMGETVCESPPYCRSVTNSVKRTVCSHCYKASTNRLPVQCERCYEVSFCSVQCRDEEMVQHAPYECNALKRMTRTRGRDKLDLDDVRVIINMLNKRYLEKARLTMGTAGADAEATGDTPPAPEAEAASVESSCLTSDAPEHTEDGGSQARPQANDSPEERTDAVAGHERSAVADTSVVEAEADDKVAAQQPSAASDSNLGDLGFEDVAVLVGEAEMLPTALEKKTYDEMGSFLLRILDDPLKEGLDQESATGLFCKSRFNRFGKWSKKGTAMGFGVFPWVSYFNHSCIPNLRRYQGENFGLLEVRAIRPIEAGEELCISYTDLHLTTNDRRSVLRDYFGFTCMCQRCTDTTDASDEFIAERSCPSRFCQELLLPLKEYDCQVLHCRHCGIIKPKHRPKN